MLLQISSSVPPAVSLPSSWIAPPCYPILNRTVYVFSTTYCAEGMPAIDIVYNKYKERGVIILAVNVGQPKDVAEAFVKNLRISYPVLLDTYSIAAKQYGVVRLPTTFILDRKGVIREKILGEAERDSFEKMVVNLLSF
ncbi:MAG: TlpA disulfide reductase family protein [Thermodesulfovibrionales bacterium]|nr:TlpA disulfide reductase family protein [Thermodesulfovibrionales bacterium]